MKKFALLLFSIIIACLNVIGNIPENTHKSKIDSLENILKQTAGTKKIKVLNDLSYAYLNVSPQKSIEYGDSALILAITSNNKNEQIIAISVTGLAYYLLNDTCKLLNNYIRLLNLYEETNNKFQIERAPDNLNEMFYDYLSKYDDFLETNLLISKIEEELKDYKQIADLLSDIGNAYYYMSNYDKALKYLKKALQVAQNSNDSKKAAQIYNKIGLVYIKLKEFENATLYFQPSLIIFKELNDQYGTATVLNNIGNEYFLKKDYDKAMDNYQKSLKISSESGNKGITANSLKNIGEIYIHEIKFNDAITYFEEAITNARQINSFVFLLDICNTLSELYKKISNYEKSLEYSNLYRSINDSLYRAESQRQVGGFDFKKNIQKIDNEHEILQKDNKIQALEVSGIRNIIILTITISILILILFIIIYSRYRIKTKSNKLLTEKNTQIEELKKELEILNDDLKEKTKEGTKKLQDEIDELKKVDVKRKKVLKNAEDTIYIKNNFLANMSQEIRTPLNGIIGFSNLLTTELSLLENHELYEYADGIEQSGSRLLHLLNNIIDISRIEANDMELIIAPSDINEVIKNISELYRFKANEKGLKFNIKYNKIPKAIADGACLTKIISDVIDNAIKYTDKGFINVITDYKPEENQVLIIVKDTGIGIDEAFLKHIFEPFRQESLGFSRELQGAGLGLPIAKKLLELMNGKVKVESKKTIGTSVTIFLNIAETDTSLEVEPKAVKEIVTLEDKPEKDKIDIFIVEDDRMNRIVLEKMLEKTSNNISAVDGDETIKIIGENYKKGKIFEIMLFDINLPAPWDGIKLMKEIKKRWHEYNKVPFIAQTAYAMAGDRERLLEAGFDNYIAKPVNKKELINMIYNQLKIF